MRASNNTSQMALISATCEASGTTVSSAKSTDLRCGAKVKSYLAGRVTPAFSASCSRTEMEVWSRSLKTALSMFVKLATGTKNFRLSCRNSASFFCSLRAASMFSRFGCGSRATSFFSASVCSFNCAVTSSAACFPVRRKKMAKPSSPTAAAPPTTRDKFFFNQFMSEIHRVHQLQSQTEAERH